MNGFKVDARTSAMLINHTTHTFTHACTHARMHILCPFFHHFLNIQGLKIQSPVHLCVLSIAFSCVHFFLAVYLVMRTNIVGFYTEGERANDRMRERERKLGSFHLLSETCCLSVFSPQATYDGDGHSTVCVCERDPVLKLRAAVYHRVQCN